MSIYCRYGKRLFDLIVTTTLLVILSPLFLIIMLVIRFTAGGPAFFSQVRAGRCGHPFRLYKFRSLVVNEADPTRMGKVGSDHCLVTPAGRIMRRFKIDELPQLWNVLKGEMSLVGPRPTLLEQVASYTPLQCRRLEVLPGLTGWSQVNGNTELSWDERIRLDIWYVDHFSFLLDLQILLMTADVISKGERIRRRALVEADIQQSSF
jgi:lipopolysaccharide/colanic/teichoic acid biosynthesis glycosyltransferase